LATPSIFLSARTHFYRGKRKQGIHSFDLSLPEQLASQSEEHVDTHHNSVSYVGGVDHGKIVFLGPSSVSPTPHFDQTSQRCEERLRSPQDQMERNQGIISEQSPNGPNAYREMVHKLHKAECDKPSGRVLKELVLIIIFVVITDIHMQLQCQARRIEGHKVNQIENNYMSDEENNM